MKKIELEVADTQTNVERGSCDFCETFDTIKEARALVPREPAGSGESAPQSL